MTERIAVPNKGVRGLRGSVFAVANEGEKLQYGRWLDDGHTPERAFAMFADMVADRLGAGAWRKPEQSR